ncbi:MAG: YdcF family protein [Clostridia bacterium]|nr:YdcF family protein [Clostridia bacterium]
MKTAGIIFAGALSLFAAAEAAASKGNLKGEPDVLLILGCRVRGEQAEETLTMRIERAADFLKENKNTVAVACGGIVHKDQYKSEAQVICDELVKRGVEKERIVIEDKSKTTAQNFINAKKLLNLDGKKVAFLSSEFHLMRASMIAKICNLECETVAAPSPKRLLLKNYLREFWAIPLIIKDTKGEKKNG